MGFTALGLEAYPVADGTEAKAILRTLTHDREDVAIIYIEEDIAAQLREETGIEDIFIISGATGEGVPALLDAILPLLDEGSHAVDALGEGDDEADGEAPAPWSPI